MSTQFTPRDWAQLKDKTKPRHQTFWPSEHGLNVNAAALKLEREGWVPDLYIEQFPSGLLLMTPLMVGIFDLPATNPAGHDPRQPMYTLHDAYGRLNGSVFRFLSQDNAYEFTFGEVLALVMARRLNCNVVSSFSCRYDPQPSPLMALMYASFVLEVGWRAGTQAYDNLQKYPWTLTLLGPVNEAIPSDWRPPKQGDKLEGLPQGWGPMACAAFVPLQPNDDKETP